MARNDPHRSRTVATNSLVASAQLLTARKGAVAKPARWQDEAWSYFDTIGELRFGAAWLANAMSRVRLTLATRPNAGDEPAPIEPDDPRNDYLDQLAGGQIGQSQLLSAITVQITVPGIGYIVGEPVMTGAGRIENEWRVLSADEFGVRVTGVGDGGRYTLRDESGKAQDMHPDTLAVKVWRQHPRFHAQPDSPVRAALPTLRELSLLTMHVDATATSRLAGAGILFVPTELSFPVSERNKDAEDPFVAELMDVMLTAIKDRDNASAVVPMVVKVPAEYLNAIKHVTFSTPFDEKAMALRDEAIRRFATAMDMPAEILTGMAASNHWSAWQIAESAQKLHVEPIAEIVCEALTIGFLRPLLEADGRADPDLMIWYDTTELTARPNVTDDAFKMFDRNAIGTVALRHYGGFTDSDAADQEEADIQFLRNLVTAAPSLAPLILPLLGIDLPDVYDEPLPAPVPNVPPALPVAPVPNVEPVQPVPDTRGNQPSDPGEAGLLAAADALAYRAMERVGARLTNEARRHGVNLDNIPPAELHTRFTDPTSLTNLDHLLERAWERVPEIAERYDMDADVLRSVLDAYARSIIVSRAPHSYDALAKVMGA